MQQLLASYALKLSDELGREVSESEAQSEINRIITKTSGRFPHLAFGSYTPDDIAQVAYLEALKALDKGVYDVERPLEAFLYRHIANRLSNLRRQHYFRAEAPCKCCDAFNPGPEPCERWVAWEKRNKFRMALANTHAPEGVRDPGERSDPSEFVIANELDQFILERLPADLIDDYTALKAGDSSRRLELRRVIQGLLRDSPWDTESFTRKPKLSHSDVQAIRASKELPRITAARYGVSISHVRDVQLGRARRDVPLKKTRSKLTPAQVVEIRSLKGVEPLKVTAKRFKISIPTVSQVQNRRTWKSLP